MISDIESAFDEVMKTLAKEFAKEQDGEAEGPKMTQTESKEECQMHAKNVWFSDILQYLRNAMDILDFDKYQICAFREAWPDTKWIEFNTLYNSREGFHRKLVLAEFIKDKRDIEFTEYTPSHQDMFTQDWNYRITPSCDSEKKS